jgi:hypothetical protein
LQLCSHAEKGWLDAPSGFFGLPSIQVASISAGGHSAGGRVVVAFFLSYAASRSCSPRGACARRSRHSLEVGPAQAQGDQTHRSACQKGKRAKAEDYPIGAEFDRVVDTLSASERAGENSPEFSVEISGIRESGQL